MKYLLIIVFTVSMISCCIVKRSPSVIKEDELISRRKYIGEFVDYRHTGPETFGCMHLIWIKTTLYSTFGKLAAYGKSCDFTPGEKIYLKRLYSTPGANGNWEYQIENDSMDFYLVSDFRYENNALVQASF